MILRITWQSFDTVRNDPGPDHDRHHDEHAHPAHVAHAVAADGDG